MSLTDIDRRFLLKAMSLAPAMAVTLPGWTSADAQAVGLISSDVCLVPPETTAGPFHLDTGLVRSDITEGRAGLPMVVRLQVVTADCQPVAAARVDIWHCDAIGVYSGVEGDTDTYMRGVQIAGADGVVTFQTVFPGWYPGRVVHVHYRVFLEGNPVLTSQVFFDDALAQAVHADHPAYAARGPQDTQLRADRIAQAAGKGAVAQLQIDPASNKAVAALVVGVDGGTGLMFLEQLFTKG
jgi:protocatechuate 3,4-dioxygenase beta subunit